MRMNHVPMFQVLGAVNILGAVLPYNPFPMMPPYPSIPPQQQSYSIPVPELYDDEKVLSSPSII